jgi:hypothetical protein
MGLGLVNYLATQRQSLNFFVHTLRNSTLAVNTRPEEQFELVE